MCFKIPISTLAVKCKIECNNINFPNSLSLFGNICCHLPFIFYSLPFSLKEIEKKEW